MAPMGDNDDEWIASVASYVRNAFGNSASVVTPAEVAKARAAATGPELPLDGRRAGVDPRPASCATGPTGR